MMMKTNESKDNSELTLEENNYSTSPDTPVASISAAEAKDLIKKGIEDQVTPIIEKFEKEIKTDKTTTITILTFFAAFIVFMLGDIQILKIAVGYWRIVGFSLILLSSLLFFVIVIDYISRGWISSRTENPPKQTWILLGIIGLIFLLGIVFSCLDNHDSVRSNNLKIQKMERQIKILSSQVDDLRNQEGDF